MKKLRKTSLATGAFLATTALSAPALAQLAPGLTPPPVESVVDQNGVDLTTGALAKVLASISIGPGGRGSLGFDWSTDNSKQWPIWGYVQITSAINAGGVGWDTHYAVTIGGSTETFTKYVNTNTIVQDQGRPSTFDGATYVGTDGTVATFGSSFLEDWNNGNGSAITDEPIASLTFPTGETLNYYWDIYANGNYSTADLRAATSSLGYQLRLTWASTTQVGSAVVFNMKDETCDPTAASCALVQSWPKLTWDATNKRVVDNTGKWVGFTTDSSGNRVITYPSGRTITFGSGGTGTLTYNDGRAASTYTHTGAYTTSVWLAHYPENTSNAPSRAVVIQNGLLTSDSLYDRSGTVTLATNYRYDPNTNRMTSVTRPDGTETDYGYDSRGNLNSVTQGGVTSTAIYPSSCSNLKTCDQPSSVTDADGNTTNYTYDSNSGGVATATLPTVNGVRPIINYSYSGFAAPYAPSGTTAPTIYELTKVDECTSGATCTLANTEETSTVYDPNDNLLPASVTTGSASSTGLQAKTVYTYTDVGDIETVDGPLAGTADTTRFYYDTSRRLIGSIGPDPDGSGAMMRRAVQTIYDSEGRPATVDLGTAAAQGDSDLTNMSVLQQQVTTYDAQGRVAAIRAKAGNTTYSLEQRSYSDAGALKCDAVRMDSTNSFGSAPADGSTDAACNLTARQAGSTIPPDRITQFGHDIYYRPTTTTSGYGTTAASVDVTNSYNSLGQLASVTDANGNITSYGYDGMGRLITTTYPGGTTNQVTSYDGNGNVLTRVNRAGQSIIFSYDALNRLTHLGGTGTPDTVYTYDNLGRTLTSTFTTGGQGITNTYDALSRLNSTSSTMGGTARQFSYQHDSAGRLTKLTYPDGFYVNYDYLTTGEVSNVRENGATTGIGVLAAYAYDPLGNRSSVTYGNGTSTTYTYDPVSRLATLTNDLAGTTYDLSIGTATNPIAYNPASEITSAAHTNDAYAWTGAANVSRAYSANTLNQYTGAGGVNFTYDANGNLTGDGTWAYGYNAINQLQTATSSSLGITANLSYDPAGRLYNFAGSGIGDRQFVYTGDQMAAEYLPSTGALYRRYVFGPGVDEPIVEYDGSGVRTWLMADERGSIVARPNDLGNSSSSRINSYDEYGIPGSTNGGRFQYTGQMYLSEIGLDYYKARLYSPTLGRFLQTDPIGYGDGMNDYAYTHNDPANGIDPSGLTDIVVTGHRPTFQPTGIIQLTDDDISGADQEGGSDADALSKLGAQAKALCGKGLKAAGKDMGGVNRAKAASDTLKEKTAKAGIPPAFLAAQGMQESDFGAPGQMHEHGHFNRPIGRGVFQITNVAGNNVPDSCAFDLSCAAGWAAHEDAVNMHAVERAHQNFSSDEILEATALSYNEGLTRFNNWYNAGGFRLAEAHSAPKTGNYGTHLLGMMPCFTGM